MKAGRARSEPLHVLCVVARGVDGKGGLERLFYYTREAKAFERLGVTVDYLASRGDAAGHAWVFAFAANYLRFLAHLASRRCDILHLNLSVGGSAYRKALLFYTARLFGKGIVIHFHGGGFEHMIGDGRWSTAIVLHLFRRADRLVLLGEFWRELVARELGIDADTIDVVHNGCPDFSGDAAIPRPPCETLRILFAGEVAPRKGADVLMGALAELARLTPDWRCVIAGHGDLDHYRGLVGDEDAQARITMTGWLAADDVHRHMRAADVVVLPSRMEGLPVCLIEGACAGAALLATDEGATRDILRDGENGYILRLDAHAFAEALARLAADRPRLAAMQSASRRIYESGFTVDAMACSLVDVYRDLAAARQRPNSRRT